MSTTSTMSKTEKIQRLRARLVVALDQATRWVELSPREAQDLDGELDYLAETFTGLGCGADAEEVENVKVVVRLKKRAHLRAFDLGMVLETMTSVLADRKVTARDLLPYAWEVVLDEEANR